jgi:hypothetical protein
MLVRFIVLRILHSTHNGDSDIGPKSAVNEELTWAFEASIHFSDQLNRKRDTRVDDLVRPAISSSSIAGEPELSIQTLRKSSTTTRPSRDLNTNKSHWTEPDRLEDRRVQVLHALAALDQWQRVCRRDRSRRCRSDKPTHRTASMGIYLLSR